MRGLLAGLALLGLVLAPAAEARCVAVVCTGDGDRDGVDDTVSAPTVFVRTVKTSDGRDTFVSTLPMTARVISADQDRNGVLEKHTATQGWSVGETNAGGGTVAVTDTAGRGDSVDRVYVHSSQGAAGHAVGVLVEYEDGSKDGRVGNPTVTPGFY